MVKRCSCGTELQFLSGEKWVCMKCEKFYTIHTEEVPPILLGAAEMIRKAIKEVDAKLPEHPYTSEVKFAEGGIIKDPALAIIDGGDSVPLGKELSTAEVITVSDSMDDSTREELDKIWENEMGLKEEKPIKVKIVEILPEIKEVMDKIDENNKEIRDAITITEKSTDIKVGVDFDEKGKAVIFNIIPPKIKVCPRCDSETFSSTKGPFGTYTSNCHNCQFGWIESYEVFEQDGDVHPVGGI